VHRKGNPVLIGGIQVLNFSYLQESKQLPFYYLFSGGSKPLFFLTLQRHRKAEFPASLAVCLLLSKASTGTECRGGEQDRKPGEQRS
jgi:hypothetical protein